MTKIPWYCSKSPEVEEGLNKTKTTIVVDTSPITRITNCKTNLLVACHQKIYVYEIEHFNKLLQYSDLAACQSPELKMIKFDNYKIFGHLCLSGFTIPHSDYYLTTLSPQRRGPHPAPKASRASKASQWNVSTPSASVADPTCLVISVFTIVEDVSFIDLMNLQLLILPLFV